MVLLVWYWKFGGKRKFDLELYGENQARKTVERLKMDFF